MGMKVLYIAEIVGKAGIWCVKSLLPKLRKELSADVIIANADGATGAHGLGRQHAGYLLKMGIDVITGGECIYYKKDLVEGFSAMNRVLRPANYPAESPGRGWKLVTVGTERLAVVSLLGRVNFPRVHSENPFLELDALSSRIRQETPYIVVDFHASATAEKQALFFHADGKVSAVIGSHGRVQSADETVLPGGTACITDAGRTGSLNSVGGTDADTRIREYLTSIPEWSRDTWNTPALQGVVLELGKDGKARSITRISIMGTVPEQETVKPELAAEGGQ